MASPTRSRSRSPARDPAEPKQKKQKKSKGGLKFKEKKQPTEDSTTATASQAASLNSKYRDRSPARRRDRDDDEENHAANGPPTMNAQREALLSKAKASAAEDAPASDTTSSAADTSAPSKPTNDIAAKFGAAAASKFANYKPRAPATSDNKTNNNDAPTPAPTATTTAPSNPPATNPTKPKPKRTVPQEPLMMVTVNDRLGTKAQIPCLGSDSVKVFKALVASKIGRKPHEIMVRRQSERPFRDQLTLADYGVSSGVQLDLEIETGD